MGKRAGAKGPDMNTHVAGGMTIGAASLDDLDAIEALEAAAFTGDRLSRRSLRAFIRAPRRPLIVARFGERLAGYALLSARKGGRAARIYSLAVDPAQARRGVGRALLQACERYARAHGLDALRLEVRYDNPAAIALYEKIGFRPFGHYPGYYEDGAAALRFEKRLAPAADASAA
jgi:ribosomal protein S18 acetylase RimI-like enzyme